MNTKQLIDALADYARQRKALEPEMYMGLDVFRRWFPELFKLSFPPGRDTATPEMMAVFAQLLAGEAPDGAALQQAFGFSSAEWEAALAAADPVRQPIPDKLVLLTFDDATRDHYEIACPLIEQYGGKAVLFVTEMEKGMFGAPGYLDAPDAYMTWEQIRELSDRGHEIANHTWHHNIFFPESTDEQIEAEVRGLEARLDAAGIPPSNAIGYPMGTCDPRVERLMRSLGYKWGRGSAVSGSPYRVGGALYDPRWDSPLVVPTVFARGKTALAEAVNACTGGKVMGLVFHSVRDEVMLPFDGITFGDAIETIYENGGRAITFAELETYVDPDKAWDYTHPVAPEPEPETMSVPGFETESA